MLVDIGEVMTAGYILLSGSAKICAEANSSTAQRWSSNGTPSTSPVVSGGRVINSSLITKLEVRVCEYQGVARS